MMEPPPRTLAAGEAPPDPGRPPTKAEVAAFVFGLHPGSRAKSVLRLLMKDLMSARPLPPAPPHTLDWKILDTNKASTVLNKCTAFIRDAHSAMGQASGSQLRAERQAQCDRAVAQWMTLHIQSDSKSEPAAADPPPFTRFMFDRQGTPEELHHVLLTTMVGTPTLQTWQPGLLVLTPVSVKHAGQEPVIEVRTAISIPPVKVDGDFHDKERKQGAPWFVAVLTRSENGPSQAVQVTGPLSGAQLVWKQPGTPGAQNPKKRRTRKAVGASTAQAPKVVDESGKVQDYHTLDSSWDALWACNRKQRARQDADPQFMAVTDADLAAIQQFMAVMSGSISAAMPMVYPELEHQVLLSLDKLMQPQTDPSRRTRSRSTAATLVATATVTSAFEFHSLLWNSATLRSRAVQDVKDILHK